MKARILTIATLATTFASVLPAVDPNLLALVMPNANVLAGVNVASAKNTPFGQYVLTQLAPKDQEFQKMAILTGFDPRQDLIELLAASTGAIGTHAGLAMATGTFNTTAILTAAKAAGATIEDYSGAMIIEDPNTKTPAGIAFLGSTVAVAGDLADLKAAIDRQSSKSAASIDSNLLHQAQSLSGSQDAWVASIIGPPPLQAPTGIVGGGKGTGLPTNALQQIVGGNAGVKFGTNVVVTAQAQADNAQDATNLAGMLQLLANMAAMQADKNPQAAALSKGLTVTASGTTVNISFTLPEDQLQQMMSHPSAAKKPAGSIPKK